MNLNTGIANNKPENSIVNPVKVPLEAIFFDLDGTLMDTLPDINSAVLATLEAFQYPPCSLVSVKEGIGAGIAQLLSACLPQELSPKPTAEVLDHMSQHFNRVYRDTCTQTSQLYPHVLSVLNYLQQKSLPLFLLSNKPQDLCDRIIDHFQLRKFFVAVRGANPEVKSKPDPEVFFMLCNQIGCNPQRVLMVGDGWQDMALAKNANSLAARKLGGYGPREPHDLYPPLFAFESYEEWPSCLLERHLLSY